MIDMMRLFDSIVAVSILLLFFAMLWIVIFTSVHAAMSLAIKKYWPDETDDEQQKGGKA